MQELTQIVSDIVINYQAQESSLLYNMFHAASLVTLGLGFVGLGVVARGLYRLSKEESDPSEQTDPLYSNGNR